LFDGGVEVAVNVGASKNDESHDEDGIDKKMACGRNN